MNVRQLLEILVQFPPDLPVLIHTGIDGCLDEVTIVEPVKGEMPAEWFGWPVDAVRIAAV